MRPTADAKRALRIALTSAVLNIVGMPIDMGFWYSRFDTIPTWHLVSFAFSAAQLLFLSTRRKTPPPWFSAVAFTLNNAVIAIALWLPSANLAGSPWQWVPFQPQKLGALAVALLAPPSVLTGIASIAIFIGSALLRFELFDPATSAGLATEPWATLAYGTFAIGLYMYRVHGRKVRSEMETALAEAKSLERLSQVLLAFRDFYNTPLQTLEFTIAVLKARHPEADALVARMERALARLGDLNRIASTYEPPTPHHIDLSLDATEILEQRDRP